MLCRITLVLYWHSKPRRTALTLTRFWPHQNARGCKRARLLRLACTHRTQMHLQVEPMQFSQERRSQLGQQICDTNQDGAPGTWAALRPEQHHQMAPAGTLPAGPLPSPALLLACTPHNHRSSRMQGASVACQTANRLAVHMAIETLPTALVEARRPQRRPPSLMRDPARRSCTELLNMHIDSNEGSRKAGLESRMCRGRAQSSCTPGWPAARLQRYPARLP